MTYISRLSISQFRNLGSIDIEPSSTVNLIYGDNGAGKSSILEAISVLATGRSFRTHKYRGLIQHDTSAFTLFAKTSDVSRETIEEGKVGVVRPKSGTSQFKIDGQNIHSAASLATNLPTLVINAKTFDLLEGSAKQRRMYFDWLVFHVKHEFGAAWKDYVKCVKQRNSLLRRDKIAYGDLYVWDKEIVRLGAVLEASRAACFEMLDQCFRDVVPQSEIGGHRVSLEYKSGWKQPEKDHLAALGESFERDRRLGYTSQGPHKADLVINCGKIPAIDVLSRGEQKTLINALLISEAKIFKQQVGRSPIVLVDDLPAELDTKHQHALCQWLEELSSQVFITGIQANELQALWHGNREKIKMFHVKHGSIELD